MLTPAYVIAILDTVGGSIAFKSTQPFVSGWSNTRHSTKREAQADVIKQASGKGDTTLRRAGMENGLLIRRRTTSSDMTPSKPGHINLDGLEYGCKYFNDALSAIRFTIKGE